MSDNSSSINPSLSEKRTNPLPSLFAPQSFCSKNLSDSSEASMSPTSILDAVNRESSEKSSYGCRTMIFQSNFRSPIEFEAMDKNSKLGQHFPGSFAVEGKLSSQRAFEELSEDYTCVISHGLNRKKTHIFENSVVESKEEEFVGTKEDKILPEMSSGSSSYHFLSFCHGCRKSLGMGMDVFMYRGEQAFCSQECRQREIISVEEEKESGFEGLLADF